MSSRIKAPAVLDWPQAVDLYHKILRHFYDRGDAAKATPHALRLLRALNQLDPKAESLPGNEYRAVIAEVDGDYEEEIFYRRRELALFDKLIRRGELESARLTWNDYSDRLDLLTIAYWNAGKLDEAWETVNRSEKICLDHGVEFGGAKLKTDLERERKRAKRRAAKHR